MEWKFAYLAPVLTGAATLLALSACLSRSFNIRASVADKKPEPTLASSDNEDMLPWIKEQISSDNPGQAKSVADLVSRLPEEYRKSYSLVYNSRSAQYSSLKFPRVVMISKFGDSFFGVTGADEKTLRDAGAQKKALGANELEYISYDRQNARYRFARVTFAGQGKAALPSLEENPAICQTCHSTRLNPLWDVYPLWPGVYGSANGTPFNEERDLLAAMLKRNIGKYHYASLEGFDRLNTLGLHDGPNAILNERMLRINLERIVREFIDHPRAKEITKAFYAATFPKEPWLDFLPADLKSAAANTLPEIKKATDTSFEKYTNDRGKRLLSSLQFLSSEVKKVGNEKSLDIALEGATLPVIDPLPRAYGSMQEKEWFEILAKWRSLAQALGIDSSRWSNNLGPNLFSYIRVYDKISCVREGLERVMGGGKLERLVHQDCKSGAVLPDTPAYAN